MNFNGDSKGNLNAKTMEMSMKNHQKKNKIYIYPVSTRMMYLLKWKMERIGTVDKTINFSF